VNVHGLNHSQSVQDAAYEHLVNLARKGKERKRNGWEGKYGEKIGDRHGWNLSRARGP